MTFKSLVIINKINIAYLENFKKDKDQNLLNKDNNADHSNLDFIKNLIKCYIDLNMNDLESFYLLAFFEKVNWELSNAKNEKYSLEEMIYLSSLLIKVYLEF